MRSLSHVAVLIPARDEEDLLPRCLASVESALRHLPPDVTSDVIVVSDRSRDRTLQIARRLLVGWGVAVKTQAGIVGAARALAAETALARFPGPAGACWLANTDADCVVPPRWLADQLILASRGADVVAGTVDIDSFAEHAPHVRDRFRHTYRIHPDGTHPHVHGANLGMRADAYLATGGWMPHLATAEDHDLWRRLERAGCRSVSTAALTVTTSGRRTGRAPQGFAAALAAHNAIERDESAA